MKIKTLELVDAALDWAVAKCEGRRPSLFIFQRTGKLDPRHNYSTDWSQAGPIMHREKMRVGPYGTADLWIAGNDKAADVGPTPLIAAMRCFVSSKLGDEVEVPDELV